MINTEPTIVTISSHGRKFTAELPWDVAMPELADAIRGLVKASGYPDELVNEYIKTDDFTPYVSDNFQIGPNGAYEHEDDLSDWDVTLNDGLENE